MTIDYVLDTSNQHPKIKIEDQEEEFLVRFELTVTNKHDKGTTFNIYGLTWAKDSEDAFKNMAEFVETGFNYKLQRKEVIGAVKDENRRKIHDQLHKLAEGYLLK